MNEIKIGFYRTRNGKIAQVHTIEDGYILGSILDGTICKMRWNTNGDVSRIFPHTLDLVERIEGGIN